VVESDVSTTVASDQACIPVYRRSIHETNAPTIGASSRLNRTIVHVRWRLAGAGEGSGMSSIGLPKARSQGYRCPGRGGHASYDYSLRLTRLVDALHGAHRTGDHLGWQTDEPEGFVESLSVGEAPRDIALEGGCFLRVVISLVQEQPTVGHDWVGMVMPLQAPRGMKMGDLPCATLLPCLSGRIGPHRAGAEVVSYWCHELVEELDPDTARHRALSLASARKPRTQGSLSGDR
jgi:hypothetical protein